MHAIQTETTLVIAHPLARRRALVVVGLAVGVSCSASIELLAFYMSTTRPPTAATLS